MPALALQGTVPASAAERNALARAEFLAAVRLRMLDYPDLNRIVSGSEADDAMILAAVSLAMSRVNHTPPLLANLEIYQVPAHILIGLTVGEILSSLTILYARNDVTFSTGSTSVQLPQANTYPQLAAALLGTATRELTEWKTARNLQQGIDATTGIASHLSMLTGPTYGVGFGYTDLRFAN